MENQEYCEILKSMFSVASHSVEPEGVSALRLYLESLMHMIKISRKHKDIHESKLRSFIAVFISMAERNHLGDLISFILYEIERDPEILVEPEEVASRIHDNGQFDKLLYPSGFWNTPFRVKYYSILLKILLGTTYYRFLEFLGMLESQVRRCNWSTKKVEDYVHIAFRVYNLVDDVDIIMSKTESLYNNYQILETKFLNSVNNPKDREIVTNYSRLKDSLSPYSLTLLLHELEMASHNEQRKIVDRALLNMDDVDVYLDQRLKKFMEKSSDLYLK